MCLSAAVRPHYYTDPDITWGRGRGLPLVVHYWAVGVAGSPVIGRRRGRSQHYCGGLDCGLPLVAFWQQQANAKCYMLVLALCLVITILGRIALLRTVTD